MKTKKRVPLYFQYRTCDAFSDYLRMQSKQGWHFKEFRFGMVFEAGQPRERFFDVEVFPNGMETDLKPEKEAEEYAEYCKAAGWKLVDSIRKFCVFEKVSDDAVAIVTPRERFENIRRAEWQRWRKYVGMYAFQLSLLAANLVWDRYGLFMNTLVILFLLAALLFAGELVCGVCLGFQMRQFRHLLEKGEIPAYHGRQKHRFRYGKIGKTFLVNFVMVGALLGLAVYEAYRQGQTFLLWYAAISFGIFLAADIFLVYFRPGRGGRLSLELVLSCALPVFLLLALFVSDDKTSGRSLEELQSQMPFTLDEIGQPKGEIALADVGFHESILGKVIFCNMVYETEHETTLDPDNPTDYPDYEIDSLLYHVYQSRCPWVVDRVWKNSKRQVGKGWKPCAEEWGASEGYASGGSYVIRYKDRVVDLLTDQPFTDSQILRIREKLGVV